MFGEFHGQRSLKGYSPWGCKEFDMTEYTGQRSVEGKGESRIEVWTNYLETVMHNSFLWDFDFTNITIK